ncbi:HAMP domain-containing sensor histidine kinase [Novosphingobium sp. ST904]|uniref:sensor histidine kinase n=1 Tax=Novosphingobium sp. ST904 TaxID=1684385 RepID=UPI0006C8CEA4|nr:HAMP domain-containing sensor histidine kinase [Novosphingobium sp. ST904]TCM25435.1 signal transduction histidine kinase [Novosphingobium sp. ST904]
MRARLGKRLRPFLRSTTFRLFVPVVLFQLVATGGVLSFVWIAGQQSVRDEQQALVEELRDDLLDTYQDGGVTALAANIERRLGSEGRRAPVLLLADAQGRSLAGNLSALPPPDPAAGGLFETVLYRSDSTQPQHMALSETRLPDGATLLAGIEIGRDLKLQHSFEQALVAALFLALPLAMLVAVLTSRLVGQRVHDMAQTAHRVGSGAFDARVALDGSGDAFDELAGEINAMLARIETLVGELRVVAEGLAHDLRSPVTRLRSALEQAALEASDPAAEAAMNRALAEADTLTRILATALQIGRAEAGIGRERFEEAALDGFLEDLAALYEPYAEEEGFTLAAEAPEGLSVLLHRELMGQALGNLIDNAVKYAGGGSAITLFAGKSEGQVVLGVRDDGPGIPEAQREAALQRFGRLDPTRSVAGSGLGLALVEAVAKLHDGLVELADAPGGGLEVRLLLGARE